MGEIQGHEMLAMMFTEPLELFIVVIFGAMVLWRVSGVLAEWCRGIVVPPDPWDAEISARLDEPEAAPVCHHCFTPQQHDRWFCPECGAAVGPYNNYLPFIYIFSIGEVARNGVYGPVRRNFVTVLGYVWFGASQYLVFAPVYWYYFFVNLRRWATPAPSDENLTVDRPE